MDSQQLQLRLLEGTIQQDAMAQYSLSQKLADGLLQVQIRGQRVEGLKALCVEISFPAEAWHLVEYAPAPEFGAGALSLGLPSGPAAVQYGQVLREYNDLVGFSGSGSLATLSFAAGPAANEPVRQASHKPELSYDPQAQAVIGARATSGDYDRNGEVNVADITPLGLYFGHVAAGASFSADQDEYYVDGDRNGEINISDLTEIGRNFGSGGLTGAVFFCRSERYLPEYGKPVQTALSFADTASYYYDNPAPETFSVPVPGAAPNGWVWFHAGKLKGGVYSGLTSEPIRIGSSDPAEQLPVATFSASVESGQAPLTVYFDARASTDADGSIVRYDWDWDGWQNGWCWEGSPSPHIGRVLQHDGCWLVTLRVTDNLGGTAFCCLPVNVSGGEIVLPEGSLQVSSGSQIQLRDIEFELTGLSDDLDRIYWDLDGNGEFDDDWRSPLSFNYPEPGPVHVMALLVGNNGLGRLLSLDLDLGEDLPPTAILRTSALYGEAPLTVHFDASQSTDDFGQGGDGLAEVHWDYDRPSYGPNEDGWQSAAWSAEAAQLAVTYFLAGTYQLTLEVEDAGGQLSQTSVTIHATGSRHLESISWCEDINPDMLSAALVDGRPAVAYHYSVPNADSNFDNFYIGYSAALSADGRIWGEPLRVTQDLGVFSAFVSLCELEGGLPGLVYYSQKNARIEYQYGLDSYGSEWSEALALCDNVSPLGGGCCEIILVGGVPAVLMGDGVHVWYRRALDPLGQVWAEPVKLKSGFFCGWPLSLSFVGAQPCALYFEDFKPYFRRSVDATGQAWAAEVALPIDEEAYFELPLTCSLLDVRGLPTLFIGGQVCQAQNQAGSLWDALPTYYPTDYASAALVGEKAFGISNNLGHAWLTELLDPVTNDWSQAGFLGAGGFCGDVIDMGGYPGIFSGPKLVSIR